MTWKLPTFLWKHPYSWWLVPQPNLKKICASHNWIEFPQGFGVHHQNPVESMRSFCGHRPETPPLNRAHPTFGSIALVCTQGGGPKEPGIAKVGDFWEVKQLWILLLGSGWGHLFLSLSATKFQRHQRENENISKFLLANFFKEFTCKNKSRFFFLRQVI